MLDEVPGQQFVPQRSVLGRHGGHAGGAGGHAGGRAGGSQFHCAVLGLLAVTELVQAAALKRLHPVHLVSCLAGGDVRSE